MDHFTNQIINSAMKKFKCQKNQDRLLLELSQLIPTKRALVSELTDLLHHHLQILGACAGRR